METPAFADGPKLTIRSGDGASDHAGPRQLSHPGAQG